MILRNSLSTFDTHDEQVIPETRRVTCLSSCLPSDVMEIASEDGTLRKVERDCVELGEDTVPFCACLIQSSTGSISTESDDADSGYVNKIKK